MGSNMGNEVFHACEIGDAEHAMADAEGLKLLKFVDDFVGVA